jgi:hypothetical protein
MDDVDRSGVSFVLSAGVDVCDDRFGDHLTISNRVLFMQLELRREDTITVFLFLETIVFIWKKI